VFIECQEEGSYAPHHIQKVAGIFKAMRTFAEDLQSKGHKVWYSRILDSRHLSIMQNLEYACVQINDFEVEIQAPDEWRLLTQLEQLGTKTHSLRIVSSEHFISDNEDFNSLFEGKKTLLMERFYRLMRKKTGLLMEGAQPLGGKWNFDESNRKAFPKRHLPSPMLFASNDVSDVVEDIIKAELPVIGSLKDPKNFYWPINREQALEVFNYWLEHGLPQFGKYQDAMLEGHWALYHSRISFALNLKMIHPLEICQQVEHVFHERTAISIESAEGFIRQIIGWREFMRGAYWMGMPEFKKANFFGFDRSLPSWFWDGKTNMNCLKQTINQSLDHAYAHHIQRLMITGNFTLLAGIDPSEVDWWYLGIYIDAFEWVEITNTRGMSQFADGGWIATKPYVSSANYINKMSNYCVGCRYNHKTRTENNSCPFNALYWDFFDQHRDKLEGNIRLAMIYKNLNRMKPEDLKSIHERAHWLRLNLNNL
jgi:deoxyribodipyrimidine photolyase-related protein